MSSAAVRAAPIAASQPTPVAASPAMREVIEAARDVAPTLTTVLLLGESGTGKELLARFLHAESRRPGPWVAVNCAALPAELLESELFGHEKGSFTGAFERRAGRFEQAQRGTLLLDEISELPLPLQAKLLRVVQEREVDRLGGQRPVPVDVRVIATSNRDLGEMVQRGLFRSDLYYRLNVFPIVLPPLRDRLEDLPALAAALIADASRELGRPAPLLDEAALVALRANPFRGNVRELRNMLERGLVRCRGPVLGAAHLGLSVGGGQAPALHGRQTPALHTPVFGGGQTPALHGGQAHAVHARGQAHALQGELPLDLGELERLAIAEALRRVRGNRTHAARLLGIGLRTLRNKLRTYREAGVNVEAAEAAAGQLWPSASGAADEIRQPWRGALRARTSQEETSEETP
jgi:two-component system response regulator FlrC